MKKVIVLTGNSLLAQGLASRLRTYSHAFEVRLVDLTSSDSLQQVSAFQPEIIIFDEGDFKGTRHPSLVDFLNSLPEVILLELRLDNSNVQLIRSVRFNASTTDELVQIFKNIGTINSSAIIG
jgi:hypothetical protein